MFPLARRLSFSLSLLMILVGNASRVLSQATSDYPLEEWRRSLSAKSDYGNQIFFEITDTIKHRDSAVIFAVIRELQAGMGSDHHYNTRVMAIEMLMQYTVHGVLARERAKVLGEALVLEANQSGDPYLAYFANHMFGSVMYTCQDLEQAAIYLLRAEEINETIPVRSNHQLRIWLQLGELFYHAREYKQAIQYLKRGLIIYDSVPLAPWVRVLTYNTIGQAYQQVGQYDSARHYYNVSMQLAPSLPEPWLTPWRGINPGCIGQLLYLKNDYDSAKMLLRYDYQLNRIKELNVAAYSLHWIAKINLQEGRRDSALLQIREALGMLQRHSEFDIQRVNYLQSAYRVAAEVFKSLNHTDSFYYYNTKFMGLHDSLQVVALNSNIKILKARLANDRNARVIASLQREKRLEEQRRNFLIVLIILITIIALLYVNRLRTRHHYREQLAQERKNAAEAFAREQLTSFTQNLLEKTKMVEELQQKLNARAASAERQELLDNIASLTILTEEDWDRFRSLFEQFHPGFFISMRERVPDISPAELRMAALTRLRLTTNQIASILGISVNSVYKTRQRLRSRLGLDGEANIEEIIGAL